MRAALLLAILALPATAATRASVSESITAGSGPYVGNSLSAGVSPGPLDLDVGYDFGSDQDLVLFHELWGSIGVWPADGVRISFDASFGPKVSSDSPSRGHYALGSAGGGGSIRYHPGHRGEVRPFFQVGGGIDHLEVEGSRTAGASGTTGNFDQTSVSGTIGADAGDTEVRAGGSAFFYAQDARALDLPPGIGTGPLGIGAVQGALPTRAEAWNVRGSLRQTFGARRAWDALLRVTYAPYVDGGGSISAVNVRIGRDFTREVRGYFGLTGQIESLARGDGTSDSSAGLYGSAGLSLLF